MTNTPNKKGARVVVYSAGALALVIGIVAALKSQYALLLLLLILGALAAWRMTKFMHTVDLRDDELIFHRPFSRVVMPLDQLQRLTAVWSDDGTLTFYFPEAKFELLMQGRATQELVRRILQESSGVEFSDPENWLSMPLKEA